MEEKKMEKKKTNPNSQPAQGQLLSLWRKARARDEVGRRGQWMERTMIFALPREPSLSHASSHSSSCCSPQMQLRLPPVHLGQTKVSPRQIKLKVPQVELRELQAVLQGSQSQFLSLLWDSLPQVPPQPQQARVTRLPPLPCLERPRDTESRGTELGSAGDKGPKPCSPCPRQPYSPVPRVFQIEKAIDVLPEDSTSDEELSPVEKDIDHFLEDSTSDKELSEVGEAIDVVPEDSRNDHELSKVDEAIKHFPGDSTSGEELSPAEDDTELSPGDKKGYKELSQGENDSDKELSQGDNNDEKKLSPEDGKHGTELSLGENYHVQAMSPWENDKKQLSQWENDVKELSQWEKHEDKELSHWKEHERGELSHWEQQENDKLTRRALLSSMERHQSSSAKPLGAKEASKCQKVLELLQGKCAETEDKDESSQGLSRLRWCKEKVKARWQHLLDSKSPLSFKAGDNVLCEGKQCGAQELSQGEGATQDNNLNKPLGWVDDEDPLEGTSWAYPGAPLGAQSPSYTWQAAHCRTRIAEVEEIYDSLSDEEERAASSSALSKELPSLWTESSHAVQHNIPASSQAGLHREHKISRETLFEALLEALIEAHGQAQDQEERDALEQLLAAQIEAAFEEKREESSVPAQHSLPSPSPAQLPAQDLHGQPAVPRKRPSRFRRALRSLRRMFHCSCLRPQPEE